MPRHERQRTHGRRDIRNLARMLGRVHALRRDGHLDARHVREAGRSEELLLLVVRGAAGRGEERARARRARGRVRRGLVVDLADGDVRREPVREAVERVAPRAPLDERRDRDAPHRLRPARVPDEMSGLNATRETGRETYPVALKLVLRSNVVMPTRFATDEIALL